MIGLCWCLLVRQWRRPPCQWLPIAVPFRELNDIQPLPLHRTLDSSCLGFRLTQAV